MNALGFLNRPIAGSIWATRALLIASLLVFIPFIVQAQTREMFSDFATSVVAAALFLRTGADASPAAPGSTDGAAALRRWYPPRETRLNNLTNVVGDSGVYGFIFDSSATPDDQYGRYNWCNMPHVRRREYVMPGEEYELRYVELVSLMRPPCCVINLEASYCLTDLTPFPRSTATISARPTPQTPSP